LTPAADGHDGAAAWQGNVEGIQQGQRINEGAGRGLGCARGRRSARQCGRPVEPVPSVPHARRGAVPVRTGKKKGKQGKNDMRARFGGERKEERAWWPAGLR
jgi:hypothetical protein